MGKLAIQKRSGNYLWFAILGLGFNPEEAIASLAAKTTTKHINLGPAMFDKPNKDAFYIVAHFLLKRLNPTRFNELYRHCWPICDHKSDSEFRKVTCSWLREIMDETANAGSQVQASLFLSPGGPKFVSLMLNLANHVMLQEMKTFKTDGTWVPETAALPASSADMAKKRLTITRARFIKSAVDQHCFLQDYQNRAQALSKSLREIQADGVKHEELLKKHSNDANQDQASLVEKAAKVRDLWSVIEGVLSATQEEQQAVQCVLRGDADLYTLDGTEKALKIPPCLLERIQKLPRQLSSGNVCEDGQLNLLSVFELTNHALELLKEEQTRVSYGFENPLVNEQLQEKCQHVSRALQDLQLIRQRMSKEEASEVLSTTRELELEWDRKWKDVLQITPLTTFLNEDPALGFMSPMTPLSFEPCPEESLKSILSQYPARLLDKPLEKQTQHEDVRTLSVEHGNACPTKDEINSPGMSSEASSRANTSLDWLFEGPLPKTQPAPLAKTKKPVTISHLPLKSRTEIIAKECDSLADQFADAVTSNGATPGRAQGLDLEDLLITLHADPFSTRKQLPRTPESLILDVKNSWRKALAEDTTKRLSSNDSIMGRLTPLQDAPFVFQSPCSSAPSQPKQTTPSAKDSTTVCGEASLMNSNLGWDTFSTELMDSPSGTGSSAVQFSLDHETLPEMPSCDSLLSLDDVEEEEVSPCLLKIPKQNTNMGVEGVFAGGVTGSESLLSPSIPALDSDWLMDSIKSEKHDDKRFSLDFNALETPSTPNLDCSLPQLITFSPIDDMKY